MKCTDDDPDYQRHLLFTSFFRKYDVPVPALIASDPGNHLALFEDVGDTTLSAWLQCTKHPDIVEQIYKTILDVLVVIHTRVTDKSGECPGLHTRLFDRKHFRWETAYFIEQFVRGVKGLTPRNESLLDSECTHLAQTVDAFDKSVLHRDFQSQNIMITRKDDIRILDYQGARMGPPAYDIVSLLWDPYYCLNDDVRIRLIDYYLKEMKNALDDRFDEYTFTQSLLPCRLQRHMQALGAYGFLSRIKGKNYFMNYVPRALVYLLDEITSVKRIYPELYELVTNCNEETHH
jgi:aminoglycoside/choline kinase family phosphotransferase